MSKKCWQWRKTCTHEVSNENKDPMFYLCPENFNKAEFKLINLVEEILRQPTIQAMVWLLLADFIQVYKCTIQV